MASFSNVLEIMKILDKTNCKACGEKTCMAFAAAVFSGKKKLGECPTISMENLRKYSDHKAKVSPLAEESEKIINGLKEELSSVNLGQRATQLGAAYNSGKITLNIMGKDFSIDKEGKAYTNVHVNPWIYISVLNYIIYSKGVQLSSSWVPMRELPSGRDWYRLFGQQCENVLKKTADNYTGLFTDLVHMFSGKQLNDQFDSDVAVALSPLPLVPILICYWQPEEEMESSLAVFFDESAEDNIGMNGLYSLGVGFALMMERLARLHSPTTTHNNN